MYRELVSIIVPIYNSDKWLDLCLKSILKQSYKNFELLLIDDGSTDNSGVICDIYAKKDSRIMVFHKKNEGVSIARNYGLSLAKGKYVQFIDSDDIVDSEMTKKLIRLIEEKNTDMVMCKVHFLDENEMYCHSLKNNNTINIGKMTKVEVLKNIIRDDGFQGFLVNKLFKKKILDLNNIKFDEHISICEDLLFCCQYLACINSVAYTTEKLYGYIQHENSALHKVNKKILTSIEAKRQIALIFDKYFLPDGRSRYIYSIVNLFTLINFDIIKDQKENLIKEIKEKKSWFNPKVHTKKECFIFYFLIINPYICGYIYIRIKKIFKRKDG